MRKTFYVSVAAIAVASGLFYLGSCTADYEEPGLSSLDIEDQIMRGKRLGPEVGGNPDADIPVNKDECALYALVSLKHKTPEGWTNSGTTAENYYNQLYKYAHDNYDYQGGRMDPSVMLNVGIHFGLLQGGKTFSKDNTASDFFKDPGKTKVRTVNFANHTGKFIRYNPKGDTVTYSDSEGVKTVPASTVVSVYY